MAGDRGGKDHSRLLYVEYLWRRPDKAVSTGTLSALYIYLTTLVPFLFDPTPARPAHPPSPPPTQEPVASSSTAVGLYPPVSPSLPCCAIVYSQIIENAPALTKPAPVSFTFPYPNRFAASSVPTHPSTARPSRSESFPAPFNPPSITL